MENLLNNIEAVVTKTLKINTHTIIIFLKDKEIKKTLINKFFLTRS